MPELVLADGEVISLEKITSDINAEHDGFLLQAADCLTHAINAGKKLMEVQDTLPRGQFMAWVEDYCNFSYESALNYMKVAARYNSKTLTDEKSIRSALRLACSNGKREPQPQEAPPCPEGAYTLILADPPWQYDFAETDNRAIENQYVTEAVEGIIRLKPKTADDCILFMWATAPKLIEAMQVMAGWGFEYRTHAMWDKEKIGMGYWFRGQHELLMVGTKGSVHPPQEGDRVGSVFREPREGHSVKPECVYEWIERSFPGFVKLEMFARRERDGWALWGNEV